MKKIILFFSILFLITGCDSDDSEVSEVQFSVIAQGEVYNGKFETPKVNLVIKNDQQWNAFKNSMSSYSVIKINETDIDFTKYEVIAVVDQVYRSGGYSIDITKISQNNRNIIVKVDQLQKGNLTSIITQPFHIVKIGKTSKRVVFK